MCLFLFLQNFCEHIERWPPLSEMMLLMGAAGKSCVDVCKERGGSFISFLFIFFFPPAILLATRLSKSFATGENFTQRMDRLTN